jgi:hypothetical protein
MVKRSLSFAAVVQLEHSHYYCNKSNPNQTAFNRVGIAQPSSGQLQISCNDDDGGYTSSDDDGGDRTAHSLTAPALRGTKEQ